MFWLYFLTSIYGPLWLRDHLCFTLAHYGGEGIHSMSIFSPISVSPQLVVGGSTPGPDPTSDPYSCFTFWSEFRGREEGQSTSVPALVPSLSHLNWLWRGLLNKNLESTFLSLLCLQKSFCCTWLNRLIAFRWPMSQKQQNAIRLFSMLLQYMCQQQILIFFSGGSMQICIPQMKLLASTKWWGVLHTYEDNNSNDKSFWLH